VGVFGVFGTLFVVQAAMRRIVRANVTRRTGALTVLGEYCSP
jgi:hypothetical protein